MSDTQTQNDGASGTDQAGGSSAGTANAGSDGGTEGSAGASTDQANDLSRAQETIRTLQADRDRARAELVALQSAAASSGSGEDGGSSADFDPESFRRSIIAEVHGATALQTAAASLRTEFPHADPALFAPDRLAGFGSPEALRLAAQDSHLRVASALESEKAAIEERLRAEFEQKYGSGAGSANGGGESGGTGDPTPQQLSAMSLDELDALEQANPGVIDRVLRSAST